MFEWMSGSNVLRFHQLPMLGRQQNVAEHSYRMALLGFSVYGPEVMASLVWPCLFHDLPEGSIGDIPAQTKWALPAETHLALSRMELAWHEEAGTAEHAYPHNEEDYRRLKFLDTAELLLTAVEQCWLGNVPYAQVFRRGFQYMTTRDLAKSAEEMALLSVMTEAVKGMGMMNDDS